MVIQVTGRHHRGTPLIRLLTRLGWQRDPDGWTVPCRDLDGRRARLLIRLAPIGITITPTAPLDGLPRQRGVIHLIPAVARPTVWELCARSQDLRTQPAGDLARSTWMNSRIHSGWSGQARAETITPSTTAAPFTNWAPAAVTSGSSAG